MLILIIHPVGHQLDADERVNIAGIFDVDVCLFLAVKLLRDLAGHLGGSECIDLAVRFGRQIGNRAANGHCQDQRQGHDEQSGLFAPISAAAAL